MVTDQDNAVIRCLNRLRQLYAEAFPPGHPGGGCLWLLTPEEVPLLEALVLTEATPGAALPDRFVTFVGGDAGAKNYPEQLRDELLAQLRVDASSLAEAGVMPATWEHAPVTRTLPEFLQYLAFVYSQLPRPTDRVAVFLHPTEVVDSGGFARMIEGTLQQRQLPPHFVLMVHAPPGSELERRLTDKVEWGVTTLRPALDIGGMQRELAQQSREGSDPATDFRVHFLDLSRYGSEGDFARMRHSGRLALELCNRTPGWDHLAMAVLCGQGTYLLRQREHQQEALTYFRKGTEAARRAVTAGNPSGPNVLLQALNFEAAGLVHLEEYGEATERYLSVAKMATEQSTEPALSMEALRMAGWCQQQLDYPQRAWELYHRALDAAEEANLESRRSSTLPYVGKELLTLADELGRRRAIPKIRERMLNLFGDDWRDQLS